MITNEGALDCKINSPCWNCKKSKENSMENIDTDLWI